MDPISIITIISFAGSCVNVLGRAVYTVHQAPSEIMALLNEISDLRLLLTVWNNAITSGADLNATAGTLMSSERDFLTKVDKLFQEFTVLTSSLYKQNADGRHYFQRALWLRKKSKVLILKRGFTSAVQVLRDVVALRNDRMAGLNDARLGRIELRQISIHRMMATLSPAATDAETATTKLLGATAMHDTGIMLQAHLPQECNMHCSCRCHYRYRQRSPMLMDRIIGHLFVGYIGLPRQGASCDTHSCSSSQVSAWRVVYTFPSWFLQATIDTVLGRGPYGNPVLNISMPSRREYDSIDSLFHLARQGKVAEMKRLLDQKLASPYDVTAGNGRTAFASALSYASATGDLEPCRLLIDYKANLDTPDDYGRTDMMNASQMALSTPDRAFASKLTLLLGMSNLVKIWDFSPLHEVILKLRTTDLSSELAKLAHRSHVDVLDVHARTALHWAAWRGDAPSVRQMLGAGANAYLADFEQLTPLHFAVVSGSEECVAMILRAGAQVTSRNAQGIDSMSFAASSVHDKPAIIQLLYAAGASVNSQDRNGVSALQDAAVENRSKNVQTLLDLGADVNLPDRDGDTALFDAVRYNSIAAIDLLLQHDIDYAHINNHGWNVLHMLSIFGTVQTLNRIAPHLDRGHAFAEDRNGRTALDVLSIRKQQDPDLERALRQLVAALVDEDDGSSVHSFQDALETQDCDQG